MKQLFLCICLLFTLTGFAKIPEPKKNTYVNDFAGILSRGEIKELNVKLHRIERLSGVQMAIVLVNKLPAEYEIEDFALLIGRKWKVGKNKNGLVYVAAIEQRKQRLEVARALVDKLTDERCAEVLAAIKPYFKQQDYSGGLMAMVDELNTDLVPQKKQVSDELNAASKPQAAIVTAEDNSTKKEETTVVEEVLWIVLGVVFLFIPIWILYRIIRWIVRMVRGNNTPNYTNPNNGYNNAGTSDMPYSGGYNSGGGSYNRGYGGGSYSSGRSGLGSALGGFAAGAATGYAARAIQDHLKEDREREAREHEAQQNNYTYQNNVSNNDNDESDYGNWGGGSDSDSSSDRDRSSNSGFDGGSGATSDW